MSVNIDHSLALWRSQMEKYYDSQDTIDELSDHIYESWLNKIQCGQNEESALVEAISELGPVKNISAEISKVEQLPSIDMWAIKFSKLAFLFCGFLALPELYGNAIEGLYFFGIRVSMIMNSYYFAPVIGTISLYAILRKIFSDCGKKFNYEFAKLLKIGAIIFVVSLTVGYLMTAVLIYELKGIKGFWEYKIHIYLLIFAVSFTCYFRKKAISIQQMSFGAAMCSLICINYWYLGSFNDSTYKLAYQVLCVALIIPLLSPIYNIKKKLI